MRKPFCRRQTLCLNSPCRSNPGRVAPLERMYQPELWHEAFVAVGTSSGAIAGLVLVAASVRANEVMTSPYWRLRARNSTLGTLAITIGSILILVPQDAMALGIELIVFNLIAAAMLPLPPVLTEMRVRAGSPIKLPLFVVFLYCVAAAGGTSLIIRWGGGLSLILGAYLALLLTVVYNTYTLLLPDSGPRTSRGP